MVSKKGDVIRGSVEANGPRQILTVWWRNGVFIRRLYVLLKIHVGTPCRNYISRLYFTPSLLSIFRVPLLISLTLFSFFPHPGPVVQLLGENLTIIIQEKYFFPQSRYKKDYSAAPRASKCSVSVTPGAVSPDHDTCLNLYALGDSHPTQ